MQNVLGSSSVVLCMYAALGWHHLSPATCRLCRSSPSDDRGQSCPPEMQSAAKQVVCADSGLADLLRATAASAVSDKIKIHIQRIEKWLALFWFNNYYTARTFFSLFVLKMTFSRTGLVVILALIYYIATRS